jgi:hypothetical protein
MPTTQKTTPRRRLVPRVFIIQFSAFAHTHCLSHNDLSCLDEAKKRDQRHASRLAVSLCLAYFANIGKVCANVTSPAIFEFVNECQLPLAINTPWQIPHQDDIAR